MAFVDRSPSAREIERLRLLLSTYQDGSGMLVTKEGGTLPGWRDFERAIALTLGGRGPENKAVFDVIVTDENDRSLKYGLSCKMRQELNRISRDGRVTIELSNSARQFWDQLELIGISKANYRQKPQEVGRTLISCINFPFSFQTQKSYPGTSR